ncbi:MAG TPA: GNAT family N-acetyltransferase [Acidobacteriota bacterium]|nr:GNAT family N-acetyltransferase [Acidobacteriota bacterium]
MGKLRVVEIAADHLLETPCCGIKNVEHEGHKAKREWLEEHFELGLKSKILLTPDGRQNGFIEYLPGEYAWRGVEAKGYMFIHCLWTYFKKYQRQGYAKRLVESCLEEARQANMKGVAVVARPKPWLASRDIFVRLGFDVVDTAPPDYDLLVKKFDSTESNPRFKGDWEKKLKKYGKGLTIIRADQCPHTLRFSSSIAEEALKTYGLKTRIEVLKTHRQAQNAPTPYAVFQLIYNGQLLVDHQISKTRFKKIMNKMVGS